MTDDEDRTQEIRRDGDRYKPPSGSPEAHGYSPEERDDTPAFGHPAASPPAPAGGQQGPIPGNYAPAPAAGYRPVGAPPSYAQPMMPTDRGSGGFPAAVIGAVVATLTAAGSSYGAYQAALHSVSVNPGTWSGFLIGRLGMVPWPGAARGGDYSTAFALGLVIVLVVTLALMMAATMSTRAGTGGFAIFLGSWMSVVIAAAIADPVAAAIWLQGARPIGWAQNYLVGGVLWGAMFGWIAALVVLIAHAVRRKPVTR